MKFSILFIICITTFFASQTHGQALRLSVIGKDSMETKRLNQIGFKKRHDNIKSIYDETVVIQQALYKQGYFQHTTDSIIAKDSLYRVYFSLHKKIHFIKAAIDTSYIEVLQVLDIEVINDSIKIKPEAFEATVHKISKAFETNGDPFSEITLIDIEVDTDFLLGKLSISRTQVRTLDKIVVKGYEKFPLSIVRHISKIKKGGVFNPTEIQEKVDKLDQLPYIENIKPPEILFAKDTTQVYLYIKKVNANYFDGFLGFATDETTQKLQLNGYLDLRLLNNLNAGESLTINWKNNGKEQSIFNANANLPYLFKSAFGIDATIHILRQDSTFTNTSTALTLAYNFNANANLGFGIENIESASLMPPSLPEFNTTDYTSFFIKPQYSYIIRSKDHPAFNEKIKLDIAFAAGSRKMATARTNQQKVYINASYQWMLNYKNRIYIRNLTESLFSNTYLYNEKYRFGGINSIRGFNENTIEATFYTIINTEYRLLLSKNLYMHSIFDVAYLEDQLLNTKNTLYGFGFGFGIVSKGGILKINYALGKFKNTAIKFSDAKIHLNFSTFF